MMTVGLSRPVNSTSLEMSKATEMIGASAACASSLCLDTSSLYCSMYILQTQAVQQSCCLYVHTVVQQALGQLTPRYRSQTSSTLKILPMPAQHIISKAQHTTPFRLTGTAGEAHENRVMTENTVQQDSSLHNALTGTLSVLVDMHGLRA